MRNGFSSDVNGVGEVSRLDRGREDEAPFNSKVEIRESLKFYLFKE